MPSRLLQTLMNGPWCVRLLSAVFPENPVKFYVHVCSSFFFKPQLPIGE